MEMLAVVEKVQAAISWKTAPEATADASATEAAEWEATREPVAVECAEEIVAAEVDVAAADVVAEVDEEPVAVEEALAVDGIDLIRSEVVDDDHCRCYYSCGCYFYSLFRCIRPQLVLIGFRRRSA